MLRKSFIPSLGILTFLVVLAGCNAAAYVPNADFNVTAGPKTAANPNYNIGTSGNLCYYVNGMEEPQNLTLTRGKTYTFGINAPGHPFYLTTDLSGGPSGLAGEITAGVTGSQTQQGTLTFTPGASTPSLIYYQCSVHTDMGGKITITG